MSEEIQQSDSTASSPDMQRSDVGAEYTVVDTDCHFVEEMADVAAYMDEPWRTRILEGGEKATMMFFPEGSGDRFKWGKMNREHSGPTGFPHGGMHIDEIKPGMDHLNVDKTIQLSHLLLLTDKISADDARTSEFAKGYVRYARDAFLDPDDGIYTLAPVPYEDEATSLEILEMVEDDPGFVGAYLLTPGSQLPLGNRKYEPIYERCEDMGLPCVFHSAGADIDSDNFQGYETMLATHTLGFLEHNMEQLTSLIVQGIPEKYPDLDIAFMECGVTWLASYLTRFDNNYLKRPEEAPHLEKKPSDYAREMYFGTQPFESNADPQFLEGVFNVMDGANSFMYSSDWPHWDYDRPSMVTDLPFLSEEEKQRVLATNAEEVFGI